MSSGKRFTGDYTFSGIDNGNVIVENLQATTIHTESGIFDANGAPYTTSTPGGSIGSFQWNNTEFAGANVYYDSDSGNVTIESTVGSNSAVTGALVVSGGVGIGGDVCISGNSTSNSAVTNSLTIYGGAGIAGDIDVGGNVLISGDAGTNSVSSGALVVVGGVGISGGLTVGLDSAFTGNISANIISASQVITNGIQNSGSLVTSSISTPTMTLGELIVASTADIGSDLTTGGNVTVGGDVESTSPVTGALIVAGGAGIGSDVYVGGNVTTQTVYTNNLFYANGAAFSFGSSYIPGQFGNLVSSAQTIPFTANWVGSSSSISIIDAPNGSPSVGSYLTPAQLLPTNNAFASDEDVPIRVTGIDGNMIYLFITTNHLSSLFSLIAVNPNIRTTIADYIVVQNAAGQTKLLSNVNVTANIFSVGLGGLDVEYGTSIFAPPGMPYTIALNTWYYEYVIATASGTVGKIFSASPTSPTLPSGYTYWARTGAVLSDNASVYTSDGFAYLYNTLQKDKEYQFILQSNTNLNSALLNIASASTSSPIPVYIRNTVPVTAKSIKLILLQTDNVGTAWVAPNMFYGDETVSYATMSYGQVNNLNDGCSAIKIDMILESDYVTYYSNLDSYTFLYVVGWTDN